MKGHSQEQKEPSLGMPGRPAEVPIHRQAASFPLLPAQVPRGLQRIAPFGLRGYIFLTSKATAVKAPQESLFRVKGGKPFNWRAASGF